MKAAKFTILLVTIIVLINWVRRGDFTGSLPTCLPLLGGREPSFYDVAGIICIAIGIIGLIRLAHNRRDDN